MGLLSLPSSDGGRLCGWNAPELGLDALLGFDNFFTIIIIIIIIITMCQVLSKR